MALIFKSVLEAGDTFGDAFEDTTGEASWYQLWVGDGETGNFVETGSGDKGWVKAGDIDSLEIDFAQFGDSVLWVREYVAGVNQDWESGAVDFSAPTEDKATDEVDGNVPLAQMFEDLNVADGTRYQIWNGDAAGETGAYLDTGDKGWLDSADVNEYFYQADAFVGDQEFQDSFSGTGNDELWIKTEVNGVSFGWEHWTVGPVVVEPEANVLEGVDMGNGVVGLHVDTTLGDLVGQDGGTIIDADDYTSEDTGPGVLRLTGDADIRVDFTNPADQVKGLDLDGNGVIDFDGVENDLSDAGVMTVSNFVMVDAYARNPKNHDDLDNNFFGDLDFDGTGFQGDGVDTDGNIVLGGLGNDTIYGGIGNDFIAGGGSVNGWDDLSGGRNADFFFVELSDLDPTDGDRLDIDGGVTFDDDPGQDSDWVLGEFSDDDEPVEVQLGANGWIVARSGIGADIDAIENFDASGNLYGFLNDYDAVLGGLGEFKDAHAADGSENYGLGSTAQLLIDGSNDDNIIVGGYDNDQIVGDDGDDVLFGGNMQFLEDNQNNPNILEIPNDGRDELYGGSGDDEIHFEMDEGVVDGEDGDDTLWLTDYTPGASTNSLEEMTTDEVVRIDLGVGVGGLTAYSGYGGADTDDTADQTNYAAGYDNTLVVDMENVNATGLGSIDYDTDGTNDSEQNFTSQMNFYGLDADLDLRGTTGDNWLFANTGDDVLEGREGDDELMGGEGNDDFYFFLNQGDDLDIIHRLSDADDDNIWDETFEQDFGTDESAEIGDSTLNLLVEETGNVGNELADITVTEISSVIFDADGDISFSLDTPEMRAADTYDELLLAVQNAIAADVAIADTLTASLVGTTIVIADAEGRELADTAPDAFFSVSGNNVEITVAMDYGQAEVQVSEDRLIFASYEDRADGELVDDDGFVNETGDPVTLGADGYAEDLVVRFEADEEGVVTTTLAEDQAYTLAFENLADEDAVSIDVNGVLFEAQMGVMPDGSAVEETQDEFIARLANEINSASDNDTLAGEILATVTVNVGNDNDTITLTQVAYNGGENVFMNTPVVELTNGSNGEPPYSTVTNNADSEITLFEFDGRDNLLNAGNTLFVGDKWMQTRNDEDSRAIFETADNDGGLLEGSETIVIDSMTDVTGDTKFSLHGDDYLLGGDGDDEILGYTGDDRIQGSAGDDVVDGGKDDYVVTTMVNGEAVISTAVFNDFEAAAKLAEADVVAVDFMEEDEVGGDANGYQDTLVFSTADFSGTSFWITADDDLAQEDGGAGWVFVDEGDNGVFEDTTSFSNMEAIRTLSGDGTHAGQGQDTLDVEALSDAVAATVADDDDVIVEYNMTRELGVIAIQADLDGDGFADDVIDPFLAVDGVEHLMGGNANDHLFIDETEARKDNTFDGDDETANGVDLFGVDAIVYDHSDMNGDGNNDVGAGDADAIAMRPSAYVTIEAATETDTIVMSGGTLLKTDSTDTLIDVEFIDLNEAAQSAVLDDTLDVTNINGATVNFVDGTVEDGADVLAGIGNMTELEDTLGSTGNDVVLIADNMTNYRNEIAAGDNNAFTFFNAAETNVMEISNQGLYSFALGDGTDTMDYRGELNDDIIAVVDFTGTDADRVIVTNDADDADYDEVDSRVDIVTGADRFYAGGVNANDSIIDVSQVGGAVTVEFSQTVVSEDERLIQITDATDVPFVKLFVDDGLTDDEKADLIPDDSQDAYWNRVEGSDSDERIILTDRESSHDVEMNLQGGSNVVEYNKNTIETTLNINDIAILDTIQEVTVDTEDNDGATSTDTITTDISVANAETLRVIGSQTGDDTIDLSALANTTSYDINLNIMENASIIGNIDINGLDPFFQDYQVVVSGYEDIIGNNADNTYTANMYVNDITAGSGDDTFIMNALTDVAGDVWDADGENAIGDTLVFGADYMGNLSIDLDNPSLGADQVVAGTTGTLIGFENLDASAVTDAGTDFTFVSAYDVVSTLRGGAGDDSLTVNDGGVLNVGTVIDGGTGADDLIFDDVAAGQANWGIAEFASGDSDAADVDTVSEFDTGADFLRIVIDLADVTGNDVAGGFASGVAADRILTAGVASVYYSTDTDEVLVDMNANGIVNATGDLVVSALAANNNDAVAEGDILYDIMGDDNANVITGGAADDILSGGAGDDTISGGFKATVGQTQTFELTGVLDNAASDWALTFNDGAAGNTLVIAEGTEFADGADADQVGAAIAAGDYSAFDVDNDATTGDIASVSYDAVTNIVTFTFSDALADAGTLVNTAGGAIPFLDLDYTTAGDTAAGGTLEIAGVADTGSPAVVADTNVAGVARIDSDDVITGGAGADTLTGDGGADIFTYAAADEFGDTITDFGATAATSDAIHFTASASGLFSAAYAVSVTGTEYIAFITGSTSSAWLTIGNGSSINTVGTSFSDTAAFLSWLTNVTNISSSAGYIAMAFNTAGTQLFIAQAAETNSDSAIDVATMIGTLGVDAAGMANGDLILV